jgi:hypothetical protein
VIPEYRAGGWNASARAWWADRGRVTNSSLVARGGVRNLRIGWNYIENIEVVGRFLDLVSKNLHTHGLKQILFPYRHRRYFDFIEVVAG